MRNLTILEETAAVLPDGHRLLDLCVDVAEQRTFAVVGDQNAVAKLLEFDSTNELADETPLPFTTSEHIASMHYLMEQEHVVIALESGDICTVRPGSGLAETVGTVDAGIATCRWSPDDEILALVTQESRLLLMTADFDVLSESALGEGQCQVAPVTVGWGTQETQYKGRQQQSSATEQHQQQTVSTDDMRVRVSWRGDAQYFGVSFVHDGRREIRVFTRDGQLHSVCEQIEALEHTLAWKPAGRVLASTEKRANRHDVIFFERNGLRHGDFTLSSNVKRVQELSWNSASSVLAAIVELEDQSVCVQLWADKNYHWYLKQELRDCGLAPRVLWDPEDPMRLLVANADGFTSLQLHSAPAVTRVPSPLSNSGACVIDGRSLLYTPFAYANVPPPMALHTLDAGDAICFVTFAAFGTGNDFALLLADRRTVVLYTCDSGKSVPCETRRFVLPDQGARQIAWPAPDTLVVLGARGVAVVDCASGSPSLRACRCDPQLLPLRLLTTSPHAKCVLVHSSHGDVLTVSLEAAEMTPLVKLPTACVELDAIDGGAVVVVGRTVRNQLYANSRLLSSECSSFFLRHDMLLLTTTTHTLRFAVASGELVTADTPFPAGDDDTDKGEARRRIERGATIVLADPVGDNVVFQMPRGNLETVRPRALVLAAVRRHLDAREYRQALLTCRTNRIDMNILYDHAPATFMTDLDDFVKQVDDPDLLNLFVSGLRDEDVTKTMYTGIVSQQHTQSSYEDAPKAVGSKTTAVCRALRPALQAADATRLMPTILTTLMCEHPPAISAALQIIAALDNTEERDATLTYLLFLSDVDTVYNAALALYDLPLALLVAQKSQHDPREYLPALGALHALENEEYRRFKIDEQLENYKRALSHLCTAFLADEQYWPELEQFTQTHLLYCECAQLLANHQRVRDIYKMYGDHLAQTKQWGQAAAAYLMSQQAVAQAVDAFVQNKEWKSAMALASMPDSGFSDQMVHDTAVKASVVLADSHKFSSAAAVLFEYTEETEDAVMLLVRGSHWAEAVRSSLARNRADLIETTILPGIDSACESLDEDISEIRDAFAAKVERLRVVRSTPLNLMSEVQSLPLDDNVDVMSDTASMASQFSTFTGTVTNASQMTGSTARRISKNKRKAERRRVRGKKGSIYEESYLVDSLSKLIDRVRVHQSAVREINLMLMQFGKSQVASKLQALFGELVEMVLKDGDWVFDQQRILTQSKGQVDLVANGANADGMSALPKHSKPTLPSADSWKINGDQLVDIVHDQVNDNTCLRVTDQPFSTNRRDTPNFSKLLAISNTYGYVVAGTPKGLSVFMTEDAREELSKGKSKGTNTAVSLSKRKEVDLTKYGRTTHIVISADELTVMVATIKGEILLFSAASLVTQGSNVPTKSIKVGGEIRDMQANPKDLPNILAVVTVSGDLVMVDTAAGTANIIVSSKDVLVTCMCWSPKGKQLVCGDSDGVLTQRTPNDGTIKRTVEPQMEDGNTPEDAAVLAVYWLDQHTYFAVYGLLPDDFFVPGWGGGGSASEDEEFEDNATAAYVITRADKKAPLEWMFIEDPCSAMMCPGRYPGFLFASISDWGSSAKHVLVMAGTGSDATLTIGEAATESNSDGSANPESLDWAQWDIDGHMAVMPMSAISENEDSPDTFPLGLAMDFTSQKELPAVVEDGGPVKPVPIMWILNTDGCLLAFHVCNLYEMSCGGYSANMVDKIKPLPGASPSAQPTTSLASGSAFGSSLGGSSFGGSSFGASKSGFSETKSSFGASSSFTPSFGGSAAASGFGGQAVAPIVKAPTSFGSAASKQAFGSGTKFGSSTGASSFSGLAAAAGASGSGKSIFESSQGSSIFDAPAKGSSMFGQPKESTNSAEPKSVSFGGVSTLGGGTKSTGFGADKPSPFAAASGSAKPAFGSSFASTTSSQPAASPFAAASGSAKPAFGSSFASAASSQLATSSPAASAASPEASKSSGLGSLGSSWGSALGSAPKATPSFGALSTGTSSLASGASKSAADTESETQRQQELEKQKAAKEEEAQKKAEEEREERELQQKTQQLIDQQYIATCNAFDGELKALASAMQQTDQDISRMRSVRLPPIKVDPTVESMASLTSRMQEMSIDDTELWNRTADVLLEALRVSRDELRASQRSMTQQMSGYVKIETKREEISRILGQSDATQRRSQESGLNPLQRDYQRRLKTAFDLIGRRCADVEQVVNVECDRLESDRDRLPRSLRAPTLNSIQRTLHNVSQTLAQKNRELDDLASIVDRLDLNDGVPSEQRRKKVRSSALSQHGNDEPLPSAPSPSTALQLPTAASGVPWSPEGPSLTTPSPFGRRSGGYGLRPEDLLVSSRAQARVSAQASPNPDSPSHGRSGKGVSSRFPHTQVRELVPRVSKPPRRTSLVVEDPDRDDLSVAAPSIYSTAATYLQTRRQRVVVREVLTRPDRLAATIRSPESSVSKARQLRNNHMPVAPQPMPNLDRYVEAFGKLKIAEPKVEPEPKVQLDSKPLAAKWECSVCEITNPESAVECMACEAPKPGAPAKQPSAAISSNASSSGLSFGVSAPSSGLSFGGSNQTSGLSFGSSNQTSGLSFGGNNQISGLSFGGNNQASGSGFGSTGTSGGFKLSGGLAFGAALSAALPKSTATTGFGSSTSFSTSTPAAPMLQAFKPPGASEPPQPAAKTSSDDKQWVCSVCELKTPDTLNECQVCEAPRPGVSAALATTSTTATTSISFGFKPSSNSPFTSFAPPASSSQNSGFSLSSKPISFGTFKPPTSNTPSVAKAADSETSAPASTDAVEWECDKCELRNPPNAQQCTVCEAPKPASAKPAIQVTKFAEPASQSSEDKDDGQASGDSAASEHSDAVEEAEQDTASEDGSQASEHSVDSDDSKHSDAVEEVEQDIASKADKQDAAELPDTFADTLKKAIVEHADDSSVEPEAQASDHGDTDDTQSIATNEHESEDKEDHDSDGFVHVSQQVSGLDDVESVGAEPTESAVSDVFDMSDLQKMLAGASVESVVDQALAAVKELKKEPAQGGQAEAPHKEHGSPHGSSTGDFVMLTRPSTSEDMSPAEPIDASEADEGLSETDEANEVLSEVSKSSEAGSEKASEAAEDGQATEANDTNEATKPGEASEAVQDSEVAEASEASYDGEELDELSKTNDAPAESTTANAELHEVESSKAASELDEDSDELDEAEASETDEADEQPEAIEFNMGSISAGIDNAMLDSADEDAESLHASGSSRMVSESEPESDDGMEEVSEPAKPQTPESTISTTEAKSFFKAGKLGSFTKFGQGGSFGSSGSSNAGAFGASSQSSSGALPNAFSQSTQATPAFGGKLDKPVFGVASMSGFGAKSSLSSSGFGSGSSSGFASMSKMSSGFGAHAASQNSFAALREKSSSVSPDDSESNSGVFGRSSGTMAFGQMSSSAFGASTKSSSPFGGSAKSAADDPIRKIIQGDDSDEDDVVDSD
ncbi:putative elongator complex protein 1 [Coemansia sp. RSA 2336]|nr:putative elongator complex protein 1 [Coemansia sp. RSA 2336]